MPCPLCGIVHAVHFHQVRPRVFRYDFEGHHQWGIVFRVICNEAKRQEKQYTLTILPHFLLPGCLVRADDVFKAGSDPAIRNDINRIGETLGVLDERTARKHRHRFDNCLQAFLLLLTGILSWTQNELSDIKPEKKCRHNKTNLNLFKILAKALAREREKLHGFENLSLFDISVLYHFFLNPAYPCATTPIITRDNLTPNHAQKRPP